MMRPKKKFALFLIQGYFSCTASITTHRQTYKHSLCLSHSVSPYLMTSKWSFFLNSFSLPLNKWKTWGYTSMYTEIAVPRPGARLLVSALWLNQACELLFVLLQCSRKQANLNHRWLATASNLKGNGGKAQAAVSEVRLLNKPRYYSIFLGTGKKEAVSHSPPEVVAENQTLWRKTCSHSTLHWSCQQRDWDSKSDWKYAAQA